MNSRFGIAVIALGLVLLCGRPPLAFSEDASRGTQRDNSGRKLAVVVPVIPHATDSIQIPSLRLEPGQSQSNSINENLRRSDALRRRIASTVSTQTALAPQVKEALGSGVIAAQDFSKGVARRMNDAATWMVTLWRELNGDPMITPGSPVEVPEPPSSIWKSLFGSGTPSGKLMASR